MPKKEKCTSVRCNEVDPVYSPHCMNESCPNWVGKCKAHGDNYERR